MKKANLHYLQFEHASLSQSPEYSAMASGFSKNMRLLNILKQSLFFVIFIHIQHLFMVVAAQLVFNNSLSEILLALRDYNPLSFEMTMMYLLPYSLISIFICPLFIYFYKALNIKSFMKALVLFLILMVLLYVMALGTGSLIQASADVPQEYALFYVWPLNLDKILIGSILNSYVLGNIVFALFFVSLWHYGLKEGFTTKENFEPYKA